MTSPGITLSAAAASRLKAIAAREGRPVMLRVAVDGGGCSGFQYRFDLVGAPEDDDLTIERDGAIAVVDVVSVALLR
ncbi:MAG: HesB/IscA family protein, partial [Caulobacteraceae bacterium]